MPELMYCNNVLLLLAFVCVCVCVITHLIRSVGFFFLFQLTDEYVHLYLHPKRQSRVCSCHMLTELTAVITG